MGWFCLRRDFGREFLSDLGAVLVEGFESGGSFLLLLRSLACFVSGRAVLGRDVLFLFVDSLLSFAGRPCSEEFFRVFPVLRFLVRRFRVVRVGWRDSVVRFLVNRLLGLGNVSWFCVSSRLEYECLRSALEALLGVVIDDRVVFDEVLRVVRDRGLPWVPGFIVGL